ncbi:uncharacterized protein [Apostichopus japonicus]|uniref:uncharacterized protein n=1 Tax=Stichopus japonicus TaxID=307972 RepID=UPI003AB68F8B
MVVQVERKPHLCLFAQKDIEENEEIRFDYGVADLPWRQMNPVDPARSSDSESICQTENPVDPARSSDSESICQTENPVDPAKSSDSESICQTENPVEPARSSDSESICQTEVTNRTRTRIPKMANFLLDDDSSDDSCVSDWRPSYCDSDSDASEEIPLNVSGESALISSLPEVTTTSLDLVAANLLEPSVSAIPIQNTDAPSSSCDATSNESDGDEDHVPVNKRRNTSRGQKAATINESDGDEDEDDVPVGNRRDISMGQIVRKYTIWEKSHEKKVMAFFRKYITGTSKKMPDQKEINDFLKTQGEDIPYN